MLGRAKSGRTARFVAFAEGAAWRKPTGRISPEHALRALVVTFDRDHRVVDQLAGHRLRGGGLDLLRAAFFWDQEDSFGCAVVRVFRTGARVPLGDELGVPLFVGSEIYVKRLKPRSTRLYSAGSGWIRNLSAASQSFTSNPGATPLALPFLVLVAFFVFRLELNRSLSKSGDEAGSCSAKRLLAYQDTKRWCPEG